MRFTAFTISAFLLLANSVVFAQEPAPSKESPPKPPLIAKVAPNAQWTITYKRKAAGKGSTKMDDARSRKLRIRYNPLVQTQRVLKGPEQMVIYTSYEAGLKSEAWIVGGYLYQLPMREGDGVGVEPRTQGDFSELYWITAANFRGTVSFKGHKVYLYETDATDFKQDSAKTSEPSDGNGDNPIKGNTHRAYVDVQTRLPVEAETGGESWTYHFADAPVTFPPMDERIAQQLKSAKE